MGFEPTTVGFGVQRSTVGATPSKLSITPVLKSKTTLEKIHFHLYLGNLI